MSKITPAGEGSTLDDRGAAHIAFRHLAQAAVNEPPKTASGQLTFRDMADAYLELVAAADAYFRRSLPYPNDPDAKRASDRLRDLIPLFPYEQQPS